jgi:lysophospholipase L1-like esterase
MKYTPLAIFLSLLAMLTTAKSADAAKLTIAIIGDSTVCNYPAEHACRGWGQFIAEHFNDSVRVVNLAASGRSTKTFIAEGRWKRTLAEKPDVVLIQFGHNDSHGAAKPESTDAATDYRDFLRRYVDESRAAHATPIFVTPMYRRTFDAEGKLTDILQPYADAMKAVAAEKKVALIDLHTTSGELFRKLGKEHCPEFANAPTDFTHFNEKGARAMAGLVMKELPAAAPQLATSLRAAPAGAR